MIISSLKGKGKKLRIPIVMEAETHRSILYIYNIGIFPMQVVSLIIAMVLTFYIFLRPNTIATILMKVYLFFTYTWIVIVYYILFGQSSFSTGRIINIILFSLIAITFFIDIFTKRTKFVFPKEKNKRYITLGIIILALFLYPLIDLAFGHPYTEVFMFGVVPCPTIIFSIALLTAAMPNVDKKVYILLLLPALGYGITGPILFNFYVDILLLGAGIYGLVILVRNWKYIGITQAK